VFLSWAVPIRLHFNFNCGPLSASISNKSTERGRNVVLPLIYIILILVVQAIRFNCVIFFLSHLLSFFIIFCPLLSSLSSRRLFNSKNPLDEYRRAYIEQCYELCIESTQYAMDRALLTRLLCDIESAEQKLGTLVAAIEVLNKDSLSIRSIETLRRLVPTAHTDQLEAISSALSLLGECRKVDLGCYDSIVKLNMAWFTLEKINPVDIQYVAPSEAADEGETSPPAKQGPTTTVTPLCTFQSVRERNAAEEVDKEESPQEKKARRF
jgi:hypothetical protein